MGEPQQRVRDRQSTRKSIQSILQRSESAFNQALVRAERAGRVEDVRMSCLNLALLKTFQTSLGEGSGDVTASAADLLGEHADTSRNGIVADRSIGSGYHAAAGICRSDFGEAERRGH